MTNIPRRASRATLRYGRDDVLGCKASYYAATNQHCGFLECYLEEHRIPNATRPARVPYAAPDWRHCTAANGAP